MVPNDALWKGIIEDLLEDFLAFFFPDVEFDLSRKPQFLDKQLEEIYPLKGKVHQRRRVDKLIKLWTKDGKEKWLLIHVEVQGYRDKELSKRIFQYFYRILDSHKQELTSLVIFSDPHKKYRPDTYTYEVAGTELTFKYRTYKILDQSEEQLQKSDNVFAIVIWTVLVALKEKRITGEELAFEKLNIVNELMRRKVSTQKIRSLINYIRFYIRLDDEELNQKFEKEVTLITGNKNIMGVEEILLEQAKDQGVKIGEKKGLEKGLEKGIRKGRKKERLELSYLISKRLILKGESNEYICDLLDVEEGFVENIRKELAG